MPTIDPTGAAGAAAGQVPGNNPLNQLDNSQEFLKLLVAQLRNQDPLNPTDPTAFMTEIAQLTAVQSQTTLAATESTVAANSMIGRQVTGRDSAGRQVTGVVDGVTLLPSGAPELDVNGTEIALATVTHVQTAAPTSTGGSTTPTP